MSLPKLLFVSPFVVCSPLSPRNYTCYLYLFSTSLLSAVTLSPVVITTDFKIFSLQEFFFLPSNCRTVESMLNESTQTREFSGKFPEVCSSEGSWCLGQRWVKGGTQPKAVFLDYLLWAPWAMRSCSPTPIHSLQENGVISLLINHLPKYTCWEALMQSRHTWNL